MAQKLKTQAPEARVAQSREETAEMIAELGRATRNLLRLEADMNDEVAKVKRDWEERAEPLRDRIAALQSGVQGWCEAHRDEITGGGKVKHHDFSSGQVSWRLRPPSVTIRGKEAIIKACEQTGLRKFLRVKTEINKEAMLEDPKMAGTLSGVTIKSAGEDFAIEPFETELADE